MAFMWRIATCLSLSVLPGQVLSQASVFADTKPAATSVPTTSAAGAPLQEAETLQLTDRVIERLLFDDATSQYAKYFAFEDSDVANGTLKHRVAFGSCKTFPGDPMWPKDDLWNLFDILLGGALIPTKPIAASCYDSKWGVKGTKACANIAINFTSPFVHLSDPTSSEHPPLENRPWAAR